MDFNQITALPTHDLMRSQEDNLQGLDFWLENQTKPISIPSLIPKIDYYLIPVLSMESASNQAKPGA